MQCLFQGDDDDEETAENFQKVRLSGSEGYLICRRLNQKNLRREPIPIRDFFYISLCNTHSGPIYQGGVDWARSFDSGAIASINSWKRLF